MKFSLILVALLGATSLFGAEQSAFKSKQAQQEAITNAQADISETKQNIEGLQSVIAGLSENNQKLSIRLNDIDSAIKEDINVQIAQIKKVQEEQNEKLDKLTVAVTALGEALGGKKTTKVDSKKTENKTDTKTETPTQTKSQKPDFTKQESAVVASNAQKNFSEKKYKEAKAAYEYLVSKNYKPALSNYMLGEIEYAQGNYAGAMPYYKASVNLYDKGDYMPRLLYHAGISSDKIGKKEDANKFYAALKQIYPESPEAKVAPNRN